MLIPLWRKKHLSVGGGEILRFARNDNRKALKVFMNTTTNRYSQPFHIFACLTTKILHFF